LDDRGRDAAEQLFLRLVTVTEGHNEARSRVRYSDLASMESASKGVDISIVDDVARMFGAHRLLTFNRDPVTRGPTVEVAHEALFTAWPRLATWIRDRREDLRLRRRLSQSVEEWAEADAHASFLLTGARLEQMQTWARTSGLHLTAAESGFLRTSGEHETAALSSRRRRRRRVITVLVAATLLSSGLAAVATVERRNADRSAGDARAEARRSEAGRLATRSGQHIEDRLDVALLLAVEAHHRDPSPEAASALWNALSATNPPLSSPHGALDGFLFPQLDVVRALDVSADGTLAAFGGSFEGTGRLVVIDIETGEMRSSVDVGSTVTALSVAGESIVFATDRGTLEMFTSSGNGKGAVVLNRSRTDPIVAVDTSQDGRLVATGSSRGVVSIWDLGQPGVGSVHLGESQGTPVSVRFSSSGVLAATSTGGVQLWNPVTGETLGPELRPLAPGPPVALLSFSPDNRRLAGAGIDGLITVWGIDASRSVLASYPNTYPRALEFAPASATDTLAISSRTGELLIADASSDSPTVVRRGWGAVDAVLAFAPDGSRLITGGASGRAARWVSPRGPTATSDPLPHDWVGGRSGGDGERAVGWARDHDGSIRRVDVVDLSNGRLVTSVSGSGNSNGCCVLDAQLAPTGRTLVIGSAVHEDFTGRMFSFTDVESGALIGTVTVDDTTLSAAPFQVSPDGTLIAVVTSRGVEIWSPKTGQIALLVGRDGDVATAASFVDNGDVAVAFAGSRQRIELFQHDTWRSLVELTAPSTIRSLAFNRSARVLIGGGDDGLIARWDLSTRAPLAPWRADVGTIVELSIAAHGEVIAAGLSSAVAFVDANGNTIGVPLGLESRIWPVSFTADDGREAIVATSSGVRRIRLDPIAWIATACALAGRELTAEEWRTFFGDEPLRPICTA
jgi:WD40 repeat protein